MRFYTSYKKHAYQARLACIIYVLCRYGVVCTSESKNPKMRYINREHVWTLLQYPGVGVLSSSGGGVVEHEHEFEYIGFHFIFGAGRKSTKITMKTIAAWHGCGCYFGTAQKSNTKRMGKFLFDKYAWKQAEENWLFIHAILCDSICQGIRGAKPKVLCQYIFTLIQLLTFFCAANAPHPIIIWFKRTANDTDGGHRDIELVLA